MITVALVERLHRACTTQRWHDHLRPIDLTVQGKQAHMMTIAWLLGKFQESRGDGIDWSYLIEGQLSGLLRKCVTSDLKAQVFDRLIARNELRLNEVVRKELSEELEPLEGDILDGFDRYFASEHDESEEQSRARKVLLAASCLATAWEFKVIEQSNAFLPEVAAVRYNIEQQKRVHQYLPGFRELDRRESDLALFVDLCGRLRFQERWSHTPILPKSFVLDHELTVANLAYLLAVERGCRPEHCINAFFGGLYHDFLEVMTRDIVAPFKRKLEELEAIVDEYALEEFESQLSRMLPEPWYEDLKFLVLEEFTCRARDASTGVTTAVGTLDPEDPAHVDACDGVMIKACDNFAAFMEAYFSLQYGVTSRDLRKALDGLYETRMMFGGGFEHIYEEWYAEV